MNSKPPRLLTLLTSTVLLLAALAAAAPGAHAAPKKCAKGKVAWKLEGRTACLPSPVAGGKASTAPAMAELWLREASRPAPGGKQFLSPALRRALPKAGALLARKFAAAANGGGGGAGISSAARGPVVEQGVVEIGKENLGNGVVAEGRIKAKRYEDSSEDLEAEFEIRDREGNSMLYQPDYNALFAEDEEVGCPTAAGRVEIETKGQMGGTVIRRKGTRVLGSKTVSKSWRVRARGQVGTDARLQSVMADVSFTTKQFERGLQYELTMATAATAPREGAPRAAGTPTASVSVKVAGASRAEESEYEQQAARELAGTPELAESVAGIASHARNHLRESEPTWYAIPNECARIAWEPGAGVTVEPGETRRLTGSVVAQRDGGQASGRIDVTVGGPGRLIPIAPGFSAGSPASFSAAGAKPNAAGISVQASAIATSTAGRAQASWSARGTEVKVPERFVGTIASSASMDGLSRDFHGSASFTRTSVLRGPDGTVYAWYELTAATVGGAKEILGPPTGCRYEAKGSNGRIESGDLELHVLPNGEVRYALLYDLKVDSVFEPTDCPPPTGDPFEGEIVVFLNSRRPGPLENQMRSAGADFMIQENGVGDVTDLPGITTTASWTLVPG